VLSELTTAGLEEVWRYFGGKNLSRYYWETYNTFGDPSTPMRQRAMVKVQVTRVASTWATPS